MLGKPGWPWLDFQYRIKLRCNNIIDLMDRLIMVAWAPRGHATRLMAMKNYFGIAPSTPLT